MPPNQLYLTVPPSANSLFVRTNNKTIKTKSYSDWQELANLEIISQLPVVHLPEKVPYSVQITANINRQRDLDNIVKPLVDALVRKSIIPDDRYLDQLEVRRTAAGEKNRVLVTWSVYG